MIAVLVVDLVGDVAEFVCGAAVAELFIEVARQVVEYQNLSTAVGGKDAINAGFDGREAGRFDGQSGGGEFAAPLAFGARATDGVGYAGLAL